MSVNAEGTSPLRFQWFKNGAPVGPLSESNALTLSSVQLSDAGSYSVTATNSAGSVTSNAATLAVTAEPVNVVPSFTTQPVGRTINAAEDQLTCVRHLRAGADDELPPAEAVRAYHAELATLGLTPHRPLDADLARTSTASAYGG